MTPSSPWALLKKAIQGQRSSRRGTLCASFAYHKERSNMWDIDLSFLHNLISNDPAYISSHKNARNLIQKIERYEIIEELVRAYLEK